MTRTGRFIAMPLVAVVSFVVGAATAVTATPPAVDRAGTTVQKVKTASSTGPFVVTDPAGADVPGARHRFSFGGRSLMTARFAATINCTGAPGRCHAEVAVLDNNNADAQVGTIFGVTHLDSTFGGEGHESHAFEGSLVLPAGDYDFQVRVTSFLCCAGSGPITADIPMWHFTMERVAT